MPIPVTDWKTAIPQLLREKARVKKLFLTHLSERYGKNPEKILKEAKKIFKNSYLAKDLDVVEI